MELKRTSHSALRESLAAYALGALPPDEYDELTNHLLDCASCQDELRGFEGTVSWMDGDAPALPDDFEEKLFARIAAEQNVTRLTPRRNWRTAATGVAASLLLLVSAWGFFDARRDGETVDRRPSAADPIQEPEGPVFHEKAGDVAASVVPTDGETLFVVSNLPPPGRSRTYQLWVQVGKNYESVSTFSIDDGMASVPIPRHHSAFKAALVTKEPIGGSIQPTTVPIIGVRTVIS